MFDEYEEQTQSHYNEPLIKLLERARAEISERLKGLEVGVEVVQKACK